MLLIVPFFFSFSFSVVASSFFSVQLTVYVRAYPFCHRKSKQAVCSFLSFYFYFAGPQSEQLLSAATVVSVCPRPGFLLPFNFLRSVFFFVSFFSLSSPLFCYLFRP